MHATFTRHSQRHKISKGLLYTSCLLLLIAFILLFLLLDFLHHIISNIEDAVGGLLAHGTLSLVQWIVPESTGLTKVVFAACDHRVPYLGPGLPADVACKWHLISVFIVVIALVLLSPLSALYPLLPVVPFLKENDIVFRQRPFSDLFSGQTWCLLRDCESSSIAGIAQTCPLNKSFLRVSISLHCSNIHPLRHICFGNNEFRWQPHECLLIAIDNAISVSLARSGTYAVQFPAWLVVASVVNELAGIPVATKTSLLVVLRREEGLRICPYLEYVRMALPAGMPNCKMSS